MNTTCLNSIYCCICIHIYMCRCTKDLAILIAICSIQHEEDCRRHHFTFHVETAFLTIRIRIWLHSVLWRVVPSPDGPCSIGTGCWITIWLVTLDALHLVKIGYSTRRTFYIIFRNQFYFNFFSMEPHLPAKSNAVSFYPLTYSC